MRDATLREYSPEGDQLSLAFGSSISFISYTTSRSSALLELTFMIFLELPHVIHGLAKVHRPRYAISKDGERVPFIRPIPLFMIYRAYSYSTTTI